MRSRLALAAAVLAFSFGVHAEGTAPIEPYGVQVLAVDAASLAMFVTAARAQAPGLAYAGVATYLFAAPILHVSHRRPGWGAASFGTRLFLPLIAGFALGELSASGSSCKGECYASPAVAGVLGGLALGAIVSSALDIFWHARPGEDEKPQMNLAPVATGRGIALTARF